MNGSAKRLKFSDARQASEGGQCQESPARQLKQESPARQLKQATLGRYFSSPASRVRPGDGGQVEANEKPGMVREWEKLMSEQQGSVHEERDKEQQAGEERMAPLDLDGGEEGERRGMAPGCNDVARVCGDMAGVCGDVAGRKCVVKEGGKGIGEEWRGTQSRELKWRRSRQATVCFGAQILFSMRGTRI